MKITSAKFMRGAVGPDELLDDGTPQVAFIGRSNVGKSSVINSLTGEKNLARTSAFPGRTQEINIFLVNKSLYLLDLPGYGYAKASREAQTRIIQLIHWYLMRSHYVPKKVVLIIDANVGTHDVEKDDTEVNPKAASKKSVGREVFPVGGLDKDAHGLVIVTNDGRITDRLLSSNYRHEKEYYVVTKNPLRSSFKEKMEAGVKIENEKTEKCKVKIMSDNAFRIILFDEKKHQVKRMCVALFQEVKDMQCTRIMNIQLGDLKGGKERPIQGDELKAFLESLKLG